MNIFKLDHDPEIAASYHISQHLAKLILESAQMLSTAVRTNNPQLQNDLIYKSAYVKHPCTIAVSSSRDIFRYVTRLGIALNIERQFRFKINHDHASVKTIKECFNYIDTIPNTNHPWPLAMPEDCKCSDDEVECYRDYYIRYKQKNKSGRWMMYYYPREIPYWIPDDLRDEIVFQEKQKELIF